MRKMYDDNDIPDELSDDEQTTKYTIPLEDDE